VIDEVSKKKLASMNAYYRALSVADRATDGPWHVEKRGIYEERVCVTDQHGNVVCDCSDEFAVNGENDAAFIAEFRSTVSSLLANQEELEQEIIGLQVDVAQNAIQQVRLETQVKDLENAMLKLLELPAVNGEARKIIDDALSRLKEDRSPLTA
jgi:hypothetical protein